MRVPVHMSFGAVGLTPDTATAGVKLLVTDESGAPLEDKSVVFRYKYELWPYNTKTGATTVVTGTGESTVSGKDLWNDPYFGPGAVLLSTREFGPEIGAPISGKLWVTARTAMDPGGFFQKELITAQPTSFERGKPWQTIPIRIPFDSFKHRLAPAEYDARPIVVGIAAAVIIGGITWFLLARS